MFEKMRTILNKVDADYSDIRYEIKKETVISFNGKELTKIGSNSTDGYVLRVLKKGGLSSVVFTKESDSEKAVNTAVNNAQLIAKNIEKPIEFAQTEVVKDVFIPELKEDPMKISMAEKLELVQKYNDIPLGYEKIATTNINYADVIREKYFISTEGAEIREDLITTRLIGEIISKDGNLIQNVRVYAGGSNGFSTIRDQESNFEERTAIALNLLKAKPVKAGVYNCILNPNMAGVFTHEAFGHFSEADIIETLPAMREKMKIGNKLGNNVLNIVDNALLPDQLGFYKYDDEGVKVHSTQLMKNGILTGRLHSRRTAAEFKEPITGHCVAEDYRYSPIVRMGNIFIEPGKNSFEELLAMLGDGLYILDAKGGQTAGENFTFGAQCGYVIKNEKLSEMIRDINISGNLYKTLQDTVAVGDDFVLSKAGACGKGQFNICSCHGGPHILVNNLTIGGV
ncbi:Zn-dependent protease [Candidatus Atribacteria bacterium HGW-Atribacteria-1]|nr:MAG: Zn-dependent protease [Candidatus Atribacteria bacterium HGW-Atribacteria-1]